MLRSRVGREHATTHTGVLTLKLRSVLCSGSASIATKRGMKASSSVTSGGRRSKGSLPSCACAEVETCATRVQGAGP
eukprot:1245090-Prymnesium_polylepis.1